MLFSEEYKKEWNRLTVDQKVTPRESKPRISRTKGHLSKRTAFVREIVKEVSGYVGCLSNNNILRHAWESRKDTRN